ncbi:MAG: hypothetical protein OXC07_02675 [Kistimonas sp.]|nr:hypothetical protein [Kistimonas sp.]
MALTPLARPLPQEIARPLPEGTDELPPAACDRRPGREEELCGCSVCIGFVLFYPERKGVLLRWLVPAQTTKKHPLSGNKTMA